jgi:small subunit ribosomal protein S6
MQLWKYEIIYILDPTSTTEDMQAVASKIEQIVNASKGAILKKDEWGKKRLAYQIKKHREGFYVFFHIALGSQFIQEINRNLRLMEKVIKFQIVKDVVSHRKIKSTPKRTRTNSSEHSSGTPKNIVRQTNAISEVNENVPATDSTSAAG